MATIGNSLAPYFTATTSDVFSANGTGTDFTLTRSISNLVDIEVLVNNIQQNPFNGAYSVNGNTLTFSEAPSAGANNVLVSYRQAVIGSSIPTPNTVASSSLQRDLTLGGNTTSNGTMFTQALVPTANVTYDIGTSTLRYKDIYLSGSTINLGDVSLSASGNTFTVANSTGGTLPSSMGNTTIAGTANVTGDMTIGGNLTVTGTMTYINTTDLNIGDAIISLNADLAANIAPTEDAGININRGASTNAQFKWIESTDNWSLGNTTVSGILTSNDHVITGTANVSTGINVGANVNLSTSQINVGNSTVNTVITSASLSTNSVTITGGAANSVAYLNASKVVTTGSALTFDGTHLGVGGLYSGYGANYPTIQAKGTYGGIFRSSDAAGNTVSLFYSSLGNYLTLGTETNYPIQFIVNNSERMRLDTSGNLGVGTTSPGAKLEVNQAATAFPGFKITGSSSPGMQIVEATGVTAHFVNDSAGVYVGSSTSYPLILRTNNTERARIDSSGNLGVNATPNAWGSTFKAIQIGAGLCLYDNSSGSGTFLGANFFYNGANNVYKNTGTAAAYAQNGGTHAWFIAPSGTAGANIAFTQAMTLDASGNLGIGVTPSAWYTVGGYKSIEIARAGNSITSLNASDIQVRTNSYLNSSGVSTYANAGFAANYEQYNGAHFWYTAPSGTAGNPITFTQAMTLQTGTYGGPQLLLATTTAGNAGTSGLYAGSRFSSGVIAYSADAFGCIRIQDTGTGTNFKSEWGLYADSYGQPFTTISFQTGIYFVTGDSGASAKIAFDTSGNAYKSSGAGSWSALSDSRIKTNVQTVTNGLSRVLQLNPVTFDYKSPEAHNGKVHDKGFIADEFMVVYPDSVTETEFVPDEDKQYIEEGSKAKAMGFNAEFYADLVAAIQEQQALITQLTARITALES